MAGEVRVNALSVRCEERVGKGGGAPVDPEPLVQAGRDLARALAEAGNSWQVHVAMQESARSRE